MGLPEMDWAELDRHKLGRNGLSFNGLGWRGGLGFPCQAGQTGLGSREQAGLAR